MRLSIVIPVLNSHEIVRRQLLHFVAMPLPDDVELILVDDGSDPPLGYSTWQPGINVQLLRTYDERPWTQPKARNIGAREAKGEFLLHTDIDHILPRDTVEVGRNYNYDFGKFKRYLGVLDEQGEFTQDEQTLRDYGARPGGLRVSCHTLSMIIRAEVFHRLGGFRERLTKYPTHDDGNMKRKLHRALKRGEITKCPDDERPIIYAFPNGRFCGSKNADPCGLFHTLER